jgi:hypothetical protein
MSGVIGHVMYAILGAKAAAQRSLPIAPLLHRHEASYLCGAYLGADIQTLPNGTDVETGLPFGYGTLPPSVTERNGRPIRPYQLVHEEKAYDSRTVTDLFYGRSHLTLGWTAADLSLTVPWDHLPDYAAAVMADVPRIHGPGERPIAFLFGWIAHIVGDALIKGVRSGLSMKLLNGLYTPENRPIQDLVAYHEIGVRELGLNWPNLLHDMATAPAEPIQSHYMRVSKPEGQLGERYPIGWQPEQSDLLAALLRANRWYFPHWVRQIIEQLKLTRDAQGIWQCDPQLSRRAGNLSYAEMIELAAQANFRHTMWQIGESIADLFQAIIETAPETHNWSDRSQPDWRTLTERWAPDSDV